MSKFHPNLRAVLTTALLPWILIGTGFRAEAQVLLQGFYWNVPCQADPNNHSDTSWWMHLATQARELRRAGFTAVWIPPVLKGNSGNRSVGYDPFDDYDLGSKDQQGSIATRYGAREALEQCVAMLRSNGLDVYLDMVENHRADRTDFHFLYKDAYGVVGKGRFQKGPLDFHPNVAQDPDVPDGVHETPFFQDLAPINGGNHYVFNGLNAAGDWLTKALDTQGYRIDDVKGISTDWLLPFLNFGAMGGKFAVGEYPGTDVGALSHWVSDSMQNRCSAFDFPLRALLKQMCDAHGAFDMGRLFQAGLAGKDPYHAVTFVENHDTDDQGGPMYAPITRNKMLGYAFLLTSEGYPCVFYRDYSMDQGCYHLKPQLDKLIWVHEKLASGPTTLRQSDHDIYAFERTGGKHLLAALNDNETAARTITVPTGFGPRVHLHDYAGHSGDVLTDAQGAVTISVPSDATGQGYVCYSVAGTKGDFVPTMLPVTQEYAGAQDLDIPPADAVMPVQVCRVWAAAGKPIAGSLYYDVSAWTVDTTIVLTLKEPSGNTSAHTYSLQTVQGEPLQLVAHKTGWHTFTIQSFRPPPANAQPAYWLKVTYTAPQTN